MSKWWGCVATAVRLRTALLKHASHIHWFRPASPVSSNSLTRTKSCEVDGMGPHFTQHSGSWKERAKWWSQALNPDIQNSNTPWVHIGTPHRTWQMWHLHTREYQLLSSLNPTDCDTAPHDYTVLLVFWKHGVGRWGSCFFQSLVSIGLSVSKWVKKKRKTSERQKKFFSTKLKAESVKCPHIAVLPRKCTGFILGTWKRSHSIIQNVHLKTDSFTKTESLMN